MLLVPKNMKISFENSAEIAISKDAKHTFSSSFTSTLLISLFLDLCFDLRLWGFSKSISCSPKF